MIHKKICIPLLPREKIFTHYIIKFYGSLMGASTFNDKCFIDEFFSFIIHLHRLICGMKRTTTNKKKTRKKELKIQPFIYTIDWKLNIAEWMCIFIRKNWWMILTNSFNQRYIILSYSLKYKKKICVANFNENSI